MWLTDGKKRKIYYHNGRAYIYTGKDKVAFLDEWENVEDGIYMSNDWMNYKAILHADGKYVTLVRFITAELVGRLLEEGYVPFLTSKEMKEWWCNRETVLASYKHTTTLGREDAEELLEYFDDNNILHIAKASAGWVTITYYADETDAKQIANYIQWMNSDERYYQHSGCAWDV